MTHCALRCQVPRCSQDTRVREKRPTSLGVPRAHLVPRVRACPLRAAPISAGLQGQLPGRPTLTCRHPTWHLPQLRVRTAWVPVSAVSRGPGGPCPAGWLCPCPPVQACTGTKPALGCRGSAGSLKMGSVHVCDTGARRSLGLPAGLQRGSMCVCVGSLWPGFASCMWSCVSIHGHTWVVSQAHTCICVMCVACHMRVVSHAMCVV